MKLCKDLSAVGAGDLVVVRTGYHGKELQRVTSTTKTQIVIGQCRYNKDGGYRRGGDSWLRSSISIPNFIDIDELERRHYFAQLANLRDDAMKTLPTKILASVCEKLSISPPPWTQELSEAEATA